MKTLAFTLFALIVAIAAVNAINKHLEIVDHPGYVEFREVEEMPGLMERFALNLEDEQIADYLGVFRNDGNAALAQELDNIRLIKVKAFSLGEVSRETVSDALKDAGISMKAQDWKTIVRVNSDKASVNIAYRNGDRHISGIAGYAVVKNHVVVANIIGTFNPKNVAALSHRVLEALQSGTIGNSQSGKRFKGERNTDAAAKAGMPNSLIDRYNLSAYPNPSSGNTTLSFTLAQETGLSLRLFDMAGNPVRTLVAEAVYPAGTHTLQWDGRAANGAPVANGNYLCRIETGTTTFSTQLTVSR